MREKKRKKIEYFRNLIVLRRDVIVTSYIKNDEVLLIIHASS